MKKRLIGFYDYTVILTLLSVISSLVGMTFAMRGHFRMAILLLAVSGFLDTFDGKVARTKKNRTDDEKLYGIQLDSLADVICFGVAPIMICFLMGMREVYDIIILCMYGLCGVIRLAFFNVLETNRQMDPNGEEKVYHGLPITLISVILPLSFLASFFVSENVFTIILRVVMLVTGLLFVLDFKVHKPKNWLIWVLIVVVGTAAISILLFSKFKLPSHSEPEEPLIETDLLEIGE